MAKFSLIPFPNMPAATAVNSIEAELNVNEESIYISFRIRNNLDLIDLGNGTPNKKRVIKLWEKTCFELFIKNEKDQFIEFNFAPNFEWNCFYFDKKGGALAEWEKMPRPESDILLSAEHFFMFVNIRKEFFPEGFFNSNKKQILSAGISSVIKEKIGSLSYWAMTHADVQPNFHHFDSFKYKF